MPRKTQCCVTFTMQLKYQPNPSYYYPQVIALLALIVGGESVASSAQ